MENKNLRDRNRDRFLNYRKQEHRELLKYSELLKKQGKSLYRESRDKSSQLLLYSGLLESQVTWEMKDEYLELLDKLIRKKITIDHFYDQFFLNLRKKRDEVGNFLESKLVLLSPDEKALGFANLIEEIFDYCESLNDGPDSPVEPKNKQFIDSMEKFYFKIQEYVNEEL